MWKEFHIRSSLISPYSDLSAPRKQLHVREVNFRSEKIQAFSKKTLRISQTSLIGFVHGLSSELRIWNSSLTHIYMVCFGKFSVNEISSPVLLM